MSLRPISVLLLSLMPLGIASAQTPPIASTHPYGFVQVTRDRTDIRCIGRTKEKCMTATKGTVLEVLFVEGDRYNHRSSNWYWVLLPPDHWGRRRTGWVRGNVIEHVQPPPALATSKEPTPTPASNASLTETPPTEPPDATPTPVEKVPAAPPAVTEVVVNFDFDKSTLTEEARRKLDSAFARPASNGQALAIIAVEGHTDSIGPEAYNKRLGLARAETVKRYLTKLGIPAERINVVSYGESRPIAPNTTREGRAQNRRVMIQVGG